MTETKIEGGYTLWARRTLTSSIFCNKPDKWFKIWFYIVNTVNHKDSKKYARGQRYFTYEMISEATGATYGQIKHCLEWLKKGKQGKQIATQKKPRGIMITVNKYHIYQDAKLYKIDKIRKTDDQTGSQTGGRTEGKQVDALYNKNDKNDKNDKEIYTTVTDYLNKQVGTAYRYNSRKLVSLVNARLQEGYTVEDFKKVIDIKSAQWLGDDKMSKFLRPETLFGVKFEGYLNEKPKQSGYTPRKIYE